RRRAEALHRVRDATVGSDLLQPGLVLGRGLELLAEALALARRATRLAVILRRGGQVDALAQLGDGLAEGIVALGGLDLLPRGLRLGHPAGELLALVSSEIAAFLLGSVGQLLHLLERGLQLLVWLH